MKFWTFFLAISLYLLHPLMAVEWKGSHEGGFSVEIAFPTNTLTVHDLLSLTITLSHPEGYDVDIDKMRAHLLQYSGMMEPPFILSSEKILESKKTGKKILFVLRPQLAGIFFFSLYDIVFFSQEQQQPITILSEIFQVEVSVPEISREPIALYPLLSISREFPIGLTEENRRNFIENLLLLSQERIKISELLEQKKLPWVQIFGFIFLIFVISILRLQPKKENKISEKFKKIMPPKEVFEVVEGLEKHYLVKTQETSNYYIALSSFLKIYIEQIYGIHTAAQTSLELTDMIRENEKVPQEQKRLFKHIFEVSDQVKFAGERPGLDEAQKIAEIMRSVLPS